MLTSYTPKNLRAGVDDIYGKAANNTIPDRQWPICLLFGRFWTPGTVDFNWEGVDEVLKGKKRPINLPLRHETQKMLQYIDKYRLGFTQWRSKRRRSNDNPSQGSSQGTTGNEIDGGEAWTVLDHRQERNRTKNIIFRVKQVLKKFKAGRKDRGARK